MRPQTNTRREAMNESSQRSTVKTRIAADANRSRAFAIAGLRRIDILVEFFHSTESRMKVWAGSMRPHHQINKNKNPILETQHDLDTRFHAFVAPRFRHFASRLTAVMTSNIRHSVLLRLLLACALLLCALSAQATECIVPAKPGGGMDGACEIKISYLPGGIGAVAWSSVVSQRRGGTDTLVTFSGGSLLNLAQGKYGKAAVSDVRWLAGVGTDYGMIAVRSDAPYKNLRELVDAMGNDPGKITIGVSGTVGSQDWLKVAMIARRADIDPKNFRFVALEGGGDSFTALQANHVQVISGDASEAA